MENEAGALIFTLATLLFISNLVWVTMIIKLLNRLMSRNYAEYVQAQRIGKNPPKPQVGLDPVVELSEKRRADELNKIMGMI